MSRWLVIGLLSALALGHAQDIPPVSDCLDTSALSRQFLAGELHEVYFQWDAFFKAVNEGKTQISKSCTIEGSRVFGILSLILKGDTAQAQFRFRLITLWDPRKEVWDLGLPLEPQRFWDWEKRYRFERTDVEAWEDKWLPPIESTPAANNAAQELRKIYHRARRIYAQASNETDYNIILLQVAGLTDPVFVLLRADVWVRTGYGSTKAEKELEAFDSPVSVVLSEYDLVQWRSRIAGIIKKQSTEKPKAKPAQPVIKPKLITTGPRK